MEDTWRDIFTWLKTPFAQLTLWRSVNKLKKGWLLMAYNFLQQTLKNWRPYPAIMKSPALQTYHVNILERVEPSVNQLRPTPLEGRCDRSCYVACYCCCCCCCLGMAPTAQLFKKGAWCFTLIDDKAPPAARDSSEVASTLNRRCYPHTGNGGLSWRLRSSPSLSWRTFYQGRSHECCPVRTTGGSLPCQRYLSATLTRNE